MGIGDCASEKQNENERVNECKRQTRPYLESPVNGGSKQLSFTITFYNRMKKKTHVGARLTILIEQKYNNPNHFMLFIYMVREE